MTDEALSRAAAFRSGRRAPAFSAGRTPLVRHSCLPVPSFLRRLPVLCWKDAFGVASICRCSQPLVGVANKRSADDEAALLVLGEVGLRGWRRRFAEMGTR